MTNRLAGERSPYLLQHAENPVHWRPWSPEVFDDARRLDRPVLLSVGYSACHWCHVMERESFADPATAELMNERFVSVKVDREERPDVDAVYMKAVQALTGRGGWPLTVFLTPGGEPFYGGTYYPPQPRHGLPSFRQVLQAVAEAWENRRDEVVRNARGLTEALERAATEGGSGGDERAATEGGSGAEGGATAHGGAADDGARLTLRAARHLAERFDESHGGFGGAPKFPQPTTLEFLLARGVEAGDDASVERVVRTLRAMAAGGIRDHLGGGFHRYSVDARWLVPHFEKMLYDNALLARLYLDAWRVTGADDLRKVAEQTLDWILADLLAPEGGFYSARDADSEGEEGRFYVWTPDEVDAAAPDPEGARLFRRLYAVEPGGNFEGASILHLPHPPAAVARSEGLDEEELRDRLEPVRRALLEARARREPPFRDEKVLASWSAFAIRALAEAGALLDRAEYLDAARAGARFVLEALVDEDGRPLHVWIDGEARVPALLEDRAALGNALLTLHEATLEPDWLDEVAGVCDDVLARFWDEERGLFHDTPVDGEALVVRPREVMDQATPSGTALAVELLLRAAHLFDREAWAAVAQRALAREGGAMARFPGGFGRLLTQRVRADAPPLEVAVMGRRGADDTRALHRAALRPYRVSKLVTGGDPEAGDVPDLPVLRGRGMGDGGAAAFVCRSYLCEAPTSDPEAVAATLAGVSASNYL